MKNIMLRKYLVFGTIILLLIFAIPTDISTNNENVEKTIGKFIEDYPNELNSLYNDYLTGYWKMDEGEGYTIYDSSGHEYDGTIYGASWTDGYSNYALDFDGFNDYVVLDDHAAALGFNKSDDLIFSFYINTTSTEMGTIYSVSNQYGVYPDIDILLNYTGSIQFHGYVQYCGVDVITDTICNDGEWYYIEIYYNGNTANPTVKIYVDDELDVELTEWICHWEYAQINNIKMGRNSNNASVFFDGKLDEFKVTKYPGGNQQAPPDISGPDEGIPNQEYEFSFITNDPEGDDVWLYVEWDDGTDTGWIGPYESGEEVILTHKWSEGGNYKIKAKSMDIWDDGPPSYHEIRIGEQPPEAPVITGPNFGELDEILEYTFITEDFEEDDIELYIDWDDGQFENWIGPYPSGEEVKISHAWTYKGLFEIKAKARDESGEGDWSEPYEILIGNDPPDAPSINGPNNGNPGTDYKFKFLSTDPDGDNIYYWVSWGDGDEVQDHGPYASGFEIELSHTWSLKGDYKIEAWARDELGAVGEKSTLDVTMPKNKAFVFNFPLVNWMLEHFPFALSILRYMMGL